MELNIKPESIAVALEPFVERHELAGAVVLVADRNRVLSLEAVGMADIEGHKPMSTDALFWIASQTKPMTGTALMMMVDQGALNLDQPISKYLPEFKGQRLLEEQHEEQPDGRALLRPPAREVTVRDTLRHTSGLPFLSPLESPFLDVLPLELAVRSYAMMPLEAEPGSRYQYSNIGINIAARVLEVVSGQSYDAFMHEHLFGPLSMNNTTFWPNEKEVARLARTYKPSETGDGLEAASLSMLQPHLSDRSRRYEVPAGGLFSTASDVVLFCQMILNGGEWKGRRYLSPAAVEQMTRRQTSPEMESYGLGWGVGESSFGHGGAYSTNMTIYPAQGLVTVFLVQHAGFPGEGNQSHGAFTQAALKLFAAR